MIQCEPYRAWLNALRVRHRLAHAFGPLLVFAHFFYREPQF